MKNPVFKFILILILATILWIFLRSGGIIPVRYGEYIGVVEIRGTISSSDTIVAWIRKLRKDSRVKGILLRINSPGGAVGPTQEILSALKRTKKPIVASFSSVAASGGYYVALAADRIVSNPGTVTGSIGVIAEFPIVNDLLKKLGIQFEVIKTGRYKDSGSPFRKMEQDERQLLQNILLDIYNQFVNEVSKSRGLPVDSVKKLADGRVFSGKMAYQAGLVDTLGSFEDAVDILKKLAKIKGEPRLLYRKVRKRFSIVDLLIDRLENKLFFEILYQMR